MGNGFALMSDLLDVNVRGLLVLVPFQKSAIWYQKLAPSSCPGQVYSVCIREADSLMVLMSDVITLAI